MISQSQGEDCFLFTPESMWLNVVILTRVLERANRILTLKCQVYRN
jgi:hypothetical protein